MSRLHICLNCFGRVGWHPHSKATNLNEKSIRYRFKTEVGAEGPCGERSCSERLGVELDVQLVSSNLSLTSAAAP